MNSSMKRKEPDTRIQEPTHHDTQSHGSVSNNSDDLVSVTNSLNMSPQKKKLRKASRACDQCRKRKIKCDYDNVSTVCNNCNKNNDKCTFERVQLKRGPSKGYTKQHTVSPDVQQQPPPAQQPQIASGKSYAQSQVLLPPISQYFPTPNPTADANRNDQPFWKVPFHELNNTSTLSGQTNARNSVDLSFQNNLQQTNTNDMLSSDNESVTPQNNNTINTVPIIRSRSSSIPPFGKYKASTPTNSNGLTNSPNYLHQSLYSAYSQFSHLQNNQSANIAFANNGLPIISQNILTSNNANLPLINPNYTNYRSKSRSGSFSIVSDAMSNPYNTKEKKRSNSIKSTPSVSTARYSINNIITIDNNIHSIDAINDSTSLDHSNQKLEKKLILSSAASSPKANHPNDKITQQSSLHQNQLNNNIVNNSQIGIMKTFNISDPDLNVSDFNTIMNFGKISDIDLINTYYEFIHINFPLIPINKRTLTNDILLINNSHPMNSKIINWFRNSLELLVRISLKKTNNQLNPTNIDKKDIGSNISKLDSNTSDDYNDENYEVYVNTINKIFQEMMILYPTVRGNQERIDSSIKIVFLLTFIILNYIQILIGKKNTFLLSTTVTIFNDSNIPSYFLFRDHLDDFSEHKIMYKRLYLLLIIFDSIQCVSYGTPTLITMPVDESLFIQLFDIKAFVKIKKIAILSEEVLENWVVEENTIRLNCIMKGFRLSMILVQLSHHKLHQVNQESVVKYIEDIKQRSDFGLMQEKPDELMCLPEAFGKLLLIKQDLIVFLFSIIDLEKNKINFLNLDDFKELTNILCSMISTILMNLTLIMRLNPTNSIDYNFKPPTHIQTNNTDSIMINESSNNPSSGSSTSNDDTSNDNVISKEKFKDSTTSTDFYRKLLGLNNDSDNILTDIKDLPRGCITPYFIIIKSEMCNLRELIKELPTALIGIIIEATIHSQMKPEDDPELEMRNKSDSDSNSNAEFKDDDNQTNVKARNIVVKLSNSMNEVVQITSLLSLINSNTGNTPYEDKKGNNANTVNGNNNINSKNTNKYSQNVMNDNRKSNSKFNRDDTLEKSYCDLINKSDNGNLSQDYRSIEQDRIKIDNGKTIAKGSKTTTAVLQKVVHIAWKLLEDSELGWL
ncbi:hypothetical protein TPHA_0C04280 [Tetrapisispora phaffii CBS 4417]|uniref:Zn(2)-C6 fungal-type domain-containing protein n=1 Tax=Tetrapisispora phaffii (strain ATCC 24235 / CBS 4417 / NBRC 1672 / NRRL Y-8282 / UCD 70-5) TaxID=1071381 RepID=G8BQR6_TETPH|nr:hypothetical protein TPHA_0C04280 [Tetrapisispora phaffii CBS 4417]CCE62578.1 hypothetical protein TPHA_0C04280 [Tetrapisispora phaffii CBS 4417]